MKTLLPLILLLSSLISIGQTSEIVFVTENATEKSVIGELHPILSRYESTILSSYLVIPQTKRMIWVVELPFRHRESALESLRNSSIVSNADFNGTVQTFDRYIPSDPRFPYQWSLDNDAGRAGKAGVDINMPEAWAIEQGSENVTLAIIDSGIKDGHPEFAGRMYLNTADPINGIDDDQNGYVDDSSGWDFTENDRIVDDERGHGTAVAGIAAANQNNFGVVGIDWHCTLLDVRVLNQNGSGSNANVAAGVYYAVNMGADVINMSLGSYFRNSVLQEAVEYAVANDVLVIAASGNDNVNEPVYPASLDGVLSVGATNWNDERSDPFLWTGSGGSNYGPNVDIVAPGDVINILNFRDFADYNNVSSGTSLAAPHVSGVATLLLAKDPSLSAYELQLILKLSADDQVGRSNEDVKGFDQYHGFGRLNASKALNTTVYGAGGKLDVQAALNGRRIIAALNANASEMWVTTMDGRVIFRAHNQSSGSHEIDVSSSGVYVVSAIIDGQMYTAKVILI